MEEEKDLICFVRNWGHKLRGRENVTYLLIFNCLKGSLLCLDGISSSPCASSVNSLFFFFLKWHWASSASLLLFHKVIVWLHKQNNLPSLHTSWEGSHLEGNLIFIKRLTSVLPLLSATWTATAIASVLNVQSINNAFCECYLPFYIPSFSLGTETPLLTVKNPSLGLVQPFIISCLTLLHLLTPFPSIPLFLSFIYVYLACDASCFVWVVNLSLWVKSGRYLGVPSYKA